jgi:CheY-like chemotaxis protein/HPt (histidine-containing phosphotransfer) domain-containing protein
MRHQQMCLNQNLDGPKTMTTSLSKEPTPASQPLRILVAEDSPLNAQVALRQLEKLGYAADMVADGSRVNAALQQANYSIILMDCQMPEMSGYEATREIREREKQLAEQGQPVKPIYIIAMTANTEADHREECVKAGMDDYINKPVQLPELEVALLRALADRAANQELEEVIDPVIIAGLRQLRMPNKPDPLVELIDLFLREAPEKLDAMTDAAARNDLSSMARFLGAATSLKGSASNLGAPNLAALCEEIEQAAKNWSLDDALPIVERARQEFARVRAVLLKIRDEPRPQG